MATKITMLRNPALAYGCDLKEGETGDVDDVLASVLIGRDIAVAVDVPKVIKAVPEVPSIVGDEPAEAPAESATEQPKKRR
jgi:hypothetical protein